MDASAFDRAIRAFATTRSRRRLLGLLGGWSLAGMLNAPREDAVASPQHGPNRGHHPDNDKDNRTGERHDQDKRSPRLSARDQDDGANPLTNPGAIEVELGYARKSGLCCQGAAAYTMPPGATESFATEETEAYLWVANRYFLDFDNPLISLPQKD